MTTKTLLPKILALLVVLLTAAPAWAQFRVIGYMPSWAGSVSSVQYSKLTHINYAFLLPTNTGGLQPIENPAKLQSLVSTAHANGVKVLISVGGWNNGDDSAFEQFAANAAYRTAFVNNIVGFVNQYGLDGADIDWEYPDAGASANNYAALMQQLATTLHGQGKLLTAAVVGTGGDSILGSVFGYVDFLNLMAYDANNFDHSTYGYATQSINYWKGRGLPANKLSLGVPFYGRPSWESFAQLIARGADPYADVFSGVGYNGINTIKSKTNLAYDQGSGVMIWELSQDATGTYSLLTAINQVVTQRTGSGGTRYPIPGKIEAENYAAQSGTDKETTTDSGGGQNVDWFETGDWLDYSVNVAAAGTYTVQFRVASANGGATLQLRNSGGGVLGSIAVGNTGGWQGWQTISTNVTLPAGAQTLRLYAAASTGCNVNWLNFATPGSAFSVTLQAEAANVNNGMIVETCTDAGGGQNMGYVDAGDYLVWNNLTFPSTGSYTIEYRVASGGSGGTISADLNAGSIQFGNTTIPGTGGWQTWTTVSRTVTINAGTYNFGIYAQSGGWNLNWVRITRNAARAATADAGATSPAATEAAPLELYPNPVQHTLHLLLLPGQPQQLTVSNLLGRAVLRQEQPGTQAATQLDVTTLPKGVYLLTVETAGKVQTRRFVKE